MPMRAVMVILSLSVVCLLMLAAYTLFHLDTESAGIPTDIGPSEVLIDPTQHTLDEAGARARMAGNWQDTSSETRRREFRVDGTVVDTYTPESSRVGQWKLFSSATENPLRVPLEEGAIYMETVYPPEDAQYTKVLTLTEADFEIIELSSGTVTHFIRIP
ncbi:MAG: hypothetical protein KBE09_03480 [Candidatus Pacebacteria bacterium]|nr:hypothetical protein [Candidatus Paceibacterota bacterium]